MTLGRITQIGVCLIVCVAAGQPVLAQQGRILPVEDPAYAWIGRLQDRGLLTELEPGVLPYTIERVRSAVAAALDGQPDPVSARWLRLVDRRVGSGRPDDDRAEVGLTLDPALRFSTQRRLDPVRELGSVANVYPIALVSGWASWGRFTAEGAGTVDWYSQRDPDGLDASLRAYSRSENTYLGYESRHVDLHLGRFSTHWGLPGEPGLVLSANPRTIDALRLRIGNRRLSIRSFFGELDAITGDGRFTGTAGDDSVASGEERRWMAAHRLDWHPNENLYLSLSEAVLISGRGTGFSLKYLNPIQPAALETDNRPKNDENNGLLSFSFWARTKALTWSGQLVLDDFDFVHLDEPASLAGTFRVVRSALTPTLDLGTQTTVVTARAYNTGQPEGRWLHLMRGIATQFSDYVESELFVRWYADSVTPGLVLEPRVTALWQGERDIRLPFRSDGDAYGTVLTGVVEKTLRSAIRASYEPAAGIRFTLDAGINHVTALGHVPGRSRTRLSATAGVALRLFTLRSVFADD